jgi:hypothetical protein
VPKFIFERSPIEPSGKVTRYDGSNKQLELIDIVGTFIQNDTLFGSESGAEWTTGKFSSIENENDPLSQNEYFENLGDQLIDWSESNPFGEYGNLGVF